jgi:hypothetical protein
MLSPISLITYKGLSAHYGHNARIKGTSRMKRCLKLTVSDRETRITGRLGKYQVFIQKSLKRAYCLHVFFYN